MNRRSFLAALPVAATCALELQMLKNLGRISRDVRVAQSIVRAAPLNGVLTVYMIPGLQALMRDMARGFPVSSPAVSAPAASRTAVRVLPVSRRSSGAFSSMSMAPIVARWHVLSRPGGR